MSTRIVASSSLTDTIAPARHITFQSSSTSTTPDVKSPTRLRDKLPPVSSTAITLCSRKFNKPIQRHDGPSLSDPFINTTQDQRLNIDDQGNQNTAGSIQNVGVVVGLEEGSQGTFRVSLISDNSRAMLGYSPSELFALDNFLDILSDEESETLLDCIASVNGRECDTSTPDVMKLSIKRPGGMENDFSCVVHADDANPALILCELEIQEVAWSACHSSHRARKQHCQHTKDTQRRRYCRKRSTGSVTNMLGTMSRAHEGMSTADTMEGLFEHVIRTFKDITSHPNVTVHRFDKHWNSWLLAQSSQHQPYEYTAQNPDLTPQTLSPECREMYENQKVQVYHGKNAGTSYLLPRPGSSLATPVSNKSLYLRTSPTSIFDHLNDKTVETSVSTPLTVSGKLWGVISCHFDTPNPIPVSFLTRSLCRHVGDLASRKLERTLFFISMDARKSPTNKPSVQHQPESLTTPLDLLTTLGADFAVLSVHGRKEFKGSAIAPQEGFALVEYFHSQSLSEVVASIHIPTDFPALKYKPGFHHVDELLYIPLSVTGSDFVIFFREKHSVLNDRGTRGWGDNDIQHAAFIRFVYSKLSVLWKQKEGAMHETHLYKLLISNSSHEFRTLLNAITNYMEFATEGELDHRTKTFLGKAKVTSSSLLGAVRRLLEFIEKDMEGCYLSATGHRIDSQR